MKKTTLKLTALSFLVGLSVNAIAQQTITTAVPFLRISPDARSSGMGETGIATSPDAYSNFWNEGKAVFAEKKSIIGITYSPWMRDLNVKDVWYGSAAGVFKLDDKQAFTAGLRYFNQGDMTFTDNNGNQIGSGKPREWTAEVGYSRKLSEKSGLGVGLRYISSNLGATSSVNGYNFKTGNSVAGDVHYYHRNLNAAGEGLAWGVTLSNLGSKISYTDDDSQKDFIPANLGIGASYKTAFDEDNKLSFNLDINKLLVPTYDSAKQTMQQYRDQSVVSGWAKSFGDAPGGISEELQELTVGVGAEYTYKNQFGVRAGYFYENKNKGNRRYLSLGAGFTYNQLGLNIAYLFPSGSGTTRNPLSNTIRFSLLFNLDGK